MFLQKQEVYTCLKSKPTNSYCGGKLTVKIGKPMLKKQYLCLFENKQKIWLSVK